MSSMSSVAADLRDLAAWTDRAARWLEQNARRPNDDADPTQRTISFDAAMLDDFLTGFRGVPGIVEALAEQIDKRPEGRRIGCTISAASTSAGKGRQRDPGQP